jgi:PAS domain S-box-containing protein
MAPRAQERVASRGARPSSRAFGAAELLSLADRCPDVLFRYRIDPPGYDFLNRAITRITGYSRADLYADPASALKLVHHDDRGVVQDYLARGTGLVPLVFRWVRKDGSVVWIEQRNTPVFDAAHTLVAIEGIAREIQDPMLAVRPPVRVLGDMRIDLDRARLLVGGREVKLTPSEFRLLVLLTDQPGRTISRATITEALWNSSSAGHARACEVFVSKLRSKIERNSRQPARIVTVRGEGYCFILSG